MRPDVSASSGNSCNTNFDFPSTTVLAGVLFIPSTTASTAVVVVAASASTFFVVLAVILPVSGVSSSPSSVCHSGLRMNRLNSLRSVLAHRSFNPFLSTHNLCPNARTLSPSSASAHRNAQYTDNAAHTSFEFFASTLNPNVFNTACKRLTAFIRNLYTNVLSR